jgi:hypothetical protein
MDEGEDGGFGDEEFGDEGAMDVEDPEVLSVIPGFLQCVRQ